MELKMKATTFDMLYKMFNHYIGVRALWQNAVEMMECSSTKNGIEYWLDERDRERHYLNALEDMFEAIGIPYVELFDQWLHYCDNPCEEQLNVCCLILLNMVH